MGRVFEKRKHKMFARFDRMAKAFSRLGKEIAIAVKQSGPAPENNPRLRAAIQTAKGVNMPKHLIQNAIDRSGSKEGKSYDEVVYEGYGPYGVAILCETATDNINRTVANIRTIFNRGGGALGKTGSLDFIFSRKGVFKIKDTGLDPEELEFDLIDSGLEELFTDPEEKTIIIYTALTDYDTMQKALESRGLDVLSSELERIPQSYAEGLTEEQENELFEIVEKFEQDDDVQKVYHNLK
ncbi:MAG TPA: YebC/PmpR family DNA-binding transcriptional regulator [Catalimonadaceae bacterium]|nr:YebC/PmpR family DNA-binding transcriptional regulator [Catalimonadaceae bacterium]HPI11048.1 YebC/PmpR family DNA-binding transcriptional regulator [Catalimonadaceae bacterium]